VIRVVLTGSESTGKSTLAAELARHFDAALVPEFVRAFAEKKGAEISFDDHGPIARGQMALEDEHIARGRPLVIQDTDLLSTVVYCDHYFGQCPAWIVEAANARRPSLYLLCGIDVPWVPDGVRDRGDRREQMQELFRRAVVASGAPFVEISGTRDGRLRSAIDAIDNLWRRESPHKSSRAK
jgi:NadR type nicotinamide-nucleotide adenylyltransferase